MDVQPMNGSTQVIKYFIPPQRVVLCVFGFLAIVNSYTMRLCLDVTLGQMVAVNQSTSSALVSFNPGMEFKTKPSYRNFTWLPIRSILSKLSQNSKRNATKKPPTVPPVDVSKYGWSKPLQTIILASFYVGYCCSHVPGGLLAEKCGGKWVLGIGIATASIFTLLTPMVIRCGGPFALIAIRFMIGLSEGPTFPALSVLLASWVPAQERGKLGVFVFSGGQVGIFVVNLMSGVLLQWLDWPQVFYFFGGCALIWSVGFVFLCFDEPNLNPFIDESEKLYLQQEIRVLVPKSNDVRPTPWQEIFTSAPMWAVITATVQYDWSQVQFTADVPKFVKDMERTSLSESFIASVNATAPHLMNWSVSLMAGFVSDLLVNHNILSTTVMRKIMTSIAGLGPNVLKGLASCIDCNEHKGILALYNCALGVMGTYYAGIKLSPLDISPNYAGTVMGIANGLGSLTNAVAPYVADLVAKDSELPFAELRAVLWLVCTALITGEVQDFDNPEALLEKNK